MDNNHQQNLGDENNRNKSDDGICQTIQLSVPCHTKYEFSLDYKAVYNYAIPYFTVLMIISSKILEDLKNIQINPQPDRNPIVLNRIMLDM